MAEIIPFKGLYHENNRLIMRDFSDFYIKNYFISKIICNFAARNNIVYIEYV